MIDDDTSEWSDDGLPNVAPDYDPNFDEEQE